MPRFVTVPKRGILVITWIQADLKPDPQAAAFKYGNKPLSGEAREGVSVCTLCTELWGDIQLRPVSLFATVSLNHEHSLAGPQSQAIRGCVLGVAATKVGSQTFTQTPFSDTAWGAAGVEPEPSTRRPSQTVGETVVDH